MLHHLEPFDGLRPVGKTARGCGHIRYASLLLHMPINNSVRNLSCIPRLDFFSLDARSKHHSHV